jgi:hypothetical protein
LQESNNDNSQQEEEQDGLLHHDLQDNNHGPNEFVGVQEQQQS